MKKSELLEELRDLYSTFYAYTEVGVYEGVVRADSADKTYRRMEALLKKIKEEEIHE